MNEPQTVKVFNKNFNINQLEYAYIGKQLKYKTLIKYPIITIFFIILIGLFFPIGLITSFYSYIPDKVNIIILWRNLFTLLIILDILIIIGLLMPKVWCVFLKMKRSSSEYVLYKTIHQDEALKISENINKQIQTKTLTSLP